MNDLTGIDLSKIQTPSFGFDTSALARQVQAINDEMNANIEATAEYNRQKDEALFQTTEASIAQRELLEQQLAAVKEQNQQLKENNAMLKCLYEAAKKDAESSAAEAKSSRRITWISIIVCVIIGIATIVVSIIG